jgi:hypothetical protein
MAGRAAQFTLMNGASRRGLELCRALATSPLASAVFENEHAESVAASAGKVSIQSRELGARPMMSPTRYESLTFFSSAVRSESSRIVSTPPTMPPEASLRTAAVISTGRS